MSSTFVVDIDGEEWDEVLELLSYHFPNQQVMGQAIGASIDEIGDSGDNLIDSFTVERMLNTVNSTGPAVNLDHNPEEYLKRAQKSDSEVNEGIISFLIDSIPQEELEKRKDSLSTEISRYVQGEEHPPVEIFGDWLEELRDVYSTEVDPSIEIYPEFQSLDVRSDSISSVRTKLMETDHQGLRAINAAIRDVEKLESMERETYLGLQRNSDCLYDLIDILDDPMRSNMVERSEIPREFSKGMKKAGAIEQWGGKQSSWEIQVSDTYLEAMGYLLG